MDILHTGPKDEDLAHAQLPAGTLKVLQLTDTHLYSAPESRLLGINTLSSFLNVVEEYRHSDWQADMILATGDLVHDASPDGYRNLAEMLDAFETPVYCLPGNHDVPQVMRKHLCSEFVTTEAVVDVGDWRIVLLDSVIVGEVGGHLEESQFELLEKALNATDRHVLISLHHQPVPVGSRWIDDMSVDNGERLIDIAQASPQVKGILWGHVHQSYDRRLGKLRLMASPSTCVQFAPDSDDFAVDAREPGYRLLALTPDGRILSEVKRTLRMPSGLNMASAGYE